MQVNCGYYQQGYCQNCDECKARPYEINERCTHCWNCENQPGYLRFGDKNSQIKQNVKIPNEGRVIVIIKEKPEERREEKEMVMRR